MREFRFWTAIVLLAVTAVLQRRGATELVAPHMPLSSFPRAIAGWDGADQAIDLGSLQLLGAADHLSRIYRRDGTAPVGLFIAYFPSQRMKSTIHSPKHCLPGAGWTFEWSQYPDLKDAKGQFHRVGEYVIAEGDKRQFVIYWYQAHGRSIASEYKAKFYLVADAIRIHRTDGALVRVITPIDAGTVDGSKAARERAEAFAQNLLPTLPPFIPD